MYCFTPDGKFNFDNSLLEDFTSCVALGVAKAAFGLRGKGANIPADVGNAFHAGGEAHFKSWDKRRTIKAFNDEYDRLQIPPSQDERYGKKNCERIMERYVDTHPLERMPFQPIWFEEIKGMPFGAEEDGLVFWVKRDMLVKDRESGNVMPLDHKTTKVVNDWWMKKWRLSSQLSGYAWFTEMEYGKPVEGVWINVIEIKTILNSSKKCPSHKVPYSECGIEHCVFKLLHYSRTREALEKWRQDAMIEAKKAKTFIKGFGGDLRLLALAPRTGAFNHHCMFCEFADWCAVEFNPKMRDQLTDWRPWEPWNMPGAKIITPGMGGE